MVVSGGSPLRWVVRQSARRPLTLENGRNISARVTEDAYLTEITFSQSHIGLSEPVSVAATVSVLKDLVLHSATTMKRFQCRLVMFLVGNDLVSPTGIVGVLTRRSLPPSPLSIPFPSIGARATVCLAALSTRAKVARETPMR
jgi:hypothetical protein